MRPPTRCLLPVLGAVLLAGCGPDRDPGELSAQPPAGGNGVVAVEVVWVARDDDQLAARLRLRNTSDDPVDLAPAGDRLAGFRALVAGRDLSALAEVHHHEVAAARIDTLAPHAVVELELTWELDPDLGRDDYPFTLIVGNLYQDDDHLTDVVVPVGQGAPAVIPAPEDAATAAAPTPDAPQANPPVQTPPANGGVSL